VNTLEVAEVEADEVEQLPVAQLPAALEELVRRLPAVVLRWVVKEALSVTTGALLL
jgi:hypothetical protein